VIAGNPRRHQEHGGPDALAAARLDVLADFRDQLDLRLDVPCELAIDLLEVGANGLEDLREINRRLFHSGSGRTLSWAEQGVEVGRRPRRQLGRLHPVEPAICATTRVTYAGSLRFPRCGSGVKNGASVSGSIRSSGRHLMISRSADDFLYVTVPGIEI